MKTKKLNLIAITLLFCFAGCKYDTIPGDKLDLEKLAKQLTTKDKLILKKDGGHIKAFGFTAIPTSREDLEKMRMVVKMYNGSSKAGIAVPGFGGLKLGKEETCLSVYYIETKVVNNSTVPVVYGCGYSVHYLFKKINKGISIDNLPSVAASAQLSSDKTQVFYSLQTYGIIGSGLVRYFKPSVNKNFNVEGFGIMQSSIDGIQNILGDTALSRTVKFTPELLKFIKPYELEQP